jgi:hypothetical protein
VPDGWQRDFLDRFETARRALVAGIGNADVRRKRDKKLNKELPALYKQAHVTPEDGSPSGVDPALLSKLRSESPIQKRIDRLDRKHKLAGERIQELRVQVRQHLARAAIRDQFAKLALDQFDQLRTYPSLQVVDTIIGLLSELSTPQEQAEGAAEQPRKKRGRPVKFTLEQKEQALQAKNGGKTNKEVARILYGSHPTPQQVKNVPAILKHYKRSLIKETD